MSIEEHTITEVPSGTEFHIEDLHLQDRLIAEQIMKNLEISQGKWRSPFDLLMGVDYKLCADGMRVLKVLTEAMVIDHKVDRVPAPVYNGPYRPFVDLPYYRRARFGNR